ncbi:MAG: hypothetical protein K5869_08960 [Saccharofermentans sp.]|nr:hypothetical protein [Saccharofermentans sp.]
MYGKVMQNGKRVVRKAGAVLLVIAMLFSLSSCNIVQRIQKRFDNHSEDISKQELARLVSSAIKDKENVADSYSSIPENQLDGMTYSVFYQYCDILRSMSSKHGRITAFRFLTDEETAKFYADADKMAGNNAISMKSYSGLTMVELIYEEDFDKSNPCRFALQYKDGAYTLANDYAAKAVEAYDYISHYFKMISDSNTAGLESIIKPMLTDDIYISSVIKSKADYLIDYYKLHVKSSVKEYKLKTLLPTLVSYEIPETIDASGENIISRTVNLYRRNDGAFYIEDTFISKGDEVSFCLNGTPVLRCGLTYAKADILTLFGDPVIEMVDSFSKEGIADIFISFNGVMLRFEGSPTPDGTWSSARLVSISVYDNNTGAPVSTFDGRLFVGMNISELLLVYPMIDETGYVYTFETTEGTYKLEFEFDENKNVNKIRLGEVSSKAE